MNLDNVDVLYLEDVNVGLHNQFLEIKAKLRFIFSKNFSSYHMSLIHKIIKYH